MHSQQQCRHLLNDILLERIFGVVQTQITADILVFVDVSSGGKTRLENDGSL